MSADAPAGSPFIMGSQSHGRGTVTARLATALDGHAKREQSTNPRRARLFGNVAKELRRCGERRCGLRFCPRCMARRAKRDRRRLEAHLRTLPPAVELAFVTLSVGCDSPEHGWRVLRAAVAKLRTRAFFKRGVTGGIFRVETEPAKSSGRDWNVHTHALVELRLTAVLDVCDLDAAWAVLLAPSGLPGRVHIMPVTRLWEPHRDEPGVMFCNVARYLLKHVLSTWLDYSAAELEAVILFLPGKREATRFGSWRGRATRRKAS